MRSPIQFKAMFQSLAILLFVPSFLSAQYCTPTSNCSFGDGVVEFGLGPFYNASACGSDQGVAGYSDWTALTGLDLGQGVSYDGQFRSDFANQYYSIWIDSDNSDSFESSELVLTDLAVGTTLVYASITIPASIPLGSYRMRVQSAYAENSSPDPCYMPFYGETEDYTLNVIEPPSCIHVSGISLNALSATTATISWTDAGTGSAWDIEYGPSGFTPTGMPSPGFDDITNPAFIDGLSPVSNYDVYIRADCGMDNVSDVSSWTSPFSFITACGAIIPSYYNNYADGLGACWELFGLGTLADGPQDGGFTNWFNSGFANFPNIYEGSQGITMYGVNNNQWMVSPDFDLSSNGPFQVEFDMAIAAAYTQNAITLGSDDEVHFLISADFGATWNTIQYWDSSIEANPTGGHFVHSLDFYDGLIVRFAYFTTTGTVNNGFQFDYQVFLDNFRVQDEGSPLVVSVDMIIEPDCFFFGNPLADILISVSGGMTPYSFMWTGGSMNEDLVDAEAGIYTLEVTDGSGSTYTSDPIDVPGTPVLTVSAIVTNESFNNWNDGSIDITEVFGGQPPYTYSWNNAATTQDITNLINALWCVDITDNNGCTTDTCFTVEQGAPSSINEFAQEIGLRVFPNPSLDGIVYVQAEMTNNEKWELQVLDPQGRVIAQQNVFSSPVLKTQVDLTEEASGLYMVRLIRTSDGGSASTLIRR
jgi:hypothetical protein